MGMLRECRQGGGLEHELAEGNVQMRPSNRAGFPKWCLEVLWGVFVGLAVPKQCWALHGAI